MGGSPLLMGAEVCKAVRVKTYVLTPSRFNLFLTSLFPSLPTSSHTAHPTAGVRMKHVKAPWASLPVLCRGCGKQCLPGWGQDAEVQKDKVPRSSLPQDPHLCGYRLPGARGLLPTPLEVGTVSWALGLRPGAISGALTGLGLSIPAFCGRLLGWPGAERPRKRNKLTGSGTEQAPS